MERLAGGLPAQDERFLETFTNQPWYPFPTWMPTLLVGDVIAFSLLILLLVRHWGSAKAAVQSGQVERQVFHGRKAAVYLKIMKVSLAVTIIPNVLWVLALALPGWVSYYTPLPILMGLMIYAPFLVWTTPLVVLVVELLLRDGTNLTR